MLLSILLSIVTALATIALLTLSGWFITAAAIAGTVATDGIAISFNFLQPAAIIRALAVIRTLGRYSERLLSHQLTFNALTEIRCWFFAKLIPLATGRLAFLKSGDLLNRMTRDIDILDSLYLRIIIPISVAASGICLVLIFIYQYSPFTSLITFWMLLLASMVVPYLAHYFNHNNASRIVQLKAELKTLQIELLQSLTELIVFKAYNRFKERSQDSSCNLIHDQRTEKRLEALFSAIGLFISQLTLLIVLLLTAFSLQQGRLEAAEIALLLFCVMATFELAAPLPSALQILSHTIQAAKRVKHIAELPPVTLCSSSPRVLPKNNDLQLQNLSFCYPSQTEYLFKNLSLNIPAHSKIAIIGDSGAGKTTFLQLLLHYFAPNQGKILLGNSHYTELNPDELLSRFALLSQHSQLFAGTIKENLLIAKQNANDDEINTAIEAAGLTNFIKKLPQGLNTWTGEQGIKVSGGEARRIALARVYLKNAPIILLDEPTEGLDKQTAEEILLRLKNISQNKTLIIVTHKQDVLALANTIYKLEHNKFVITLPE